MKKEKLMPIEQIRSLIRLYQAQIRLSFPHSIKPTSVRLHFRTNEAVGGYALYVLERMSADCDEVALIVPYPGQASYWADLSRMALLRERIARWLGFVQCYLATSGIFTMDEIDAQNRIEADPEHKEPSSDPT